MGCTSSAAVGQRHNTSTLINVTANGVQRTKSATARQIVEMVESDWKRVVGAATLMRHVTVDENPKELSMMMERLWICQENRLFTSGPYEVAALLQLIASIQSARCWASSHTINGVVGITEYHCHTAVIVEWCVLLRLYARSEYNVHLLFGLRVIRQLMAHLQMFGEVLEVVVEVLQCLHLFNTIIQMTMSSDDYDTIVKSIKLHDHDVRVCENGCGLLWYGSRNTDNVPKLSNQRTFHLLTDILKRNKDVPGVAVAACGAISNIATNRHNVLAFDAFGAVALLVEVLRLHKRAPRIAEQACSAIRNMSAMEGIQAAFVGAVPLIIDVLELHAASEEVAERACGALRYLANNAHNQRVMNSCGAAPLLMEVFTIHKSNDTVSEQACRAVLAVSGNPDKTNCYDIVGSLQRPPINR